jgi:hypothetical protein
LDTSEEAALPGGDRSATSGKPPPTVFINFRDRDSGGWAHSLYERLRERFGADNVFLSHVSIGHGADWLEEIRARPKTCSVFIPVIGPDWVSILRERSETSEEDYVRSEIEDALQKRSPAVVLPVLVQDAKPPTENDLPSRRSLHPLFRTQMRSLRPSSWADDVQGLVEEIDRIAASPPTDGGQDGKKQPVKPPPPTTHAPDTRLPRPDPEHYQDLIKDMREGTVVPVLGPGANSCGRTDAWDAGAGSLPDAEELAAYLASKLGEKSMPADLAQISQSISVDQGEDLYRWLRQAMPSSFDPSPVHRFLAELPDELQGSQGAQPRQLIVTTNYDDALERAFEDAREPYDLAVYMASGDDQGHFVHFPFDGEPAVIRNAKGYMKFPIGDNYEVERTVIVKIHGATDGARGPYEWRNNYVITEDDYITYMSTGPIEEIVPAQIRDTLRQSHFLFLGYNAMRNTMRDWNLRVFLKRIFPEGRLRSKSWAVQKDTQKSDKDFWIGMGVSSLYVIPLVEYASELKAQIAATEALQRP